MKREDIKPWLKRRGEAVIDNALWFLLLAGLVAGGAAIWQLGSHRVVVRGWMVVLLVAVLLLLGAGVVFVLVRHLHQVEASSTPAGVSTPPAPVVEVRHRHAALLARLDALDRDVDVLTANGPAAATVIDAYNDILKRAKTGPGAADSHHAVWGLLPLAEEDVFHPVMVGDVRVSVGQLQAILEHDNG